jgi:hypothetical protein
VHEEEVRTQVADRKAHVVHTHLADGGGSLFFDRSGDPGANAAGSPERWNTRREVRGRCDPPP